MKKYSLTKWLSLAAASALTLLLGGFTSQTQAALFDPAATGDWDFYLSGDQKGVAHITFLGNNTLSGVQILRPGKMPFVPEVNGRGGRLNPDDPRGTATVTSNRLFLEFGGQVIAGVWGYDFNGKLLGSITLTSSSSTNGLSFRGSGKTGKYMTLHATRADSGSRIMYHGVPRTVLPDISGTYFVSGKKTMTYSTDSEPFTEIMTLTASGSSYPSGTPNYYSVVKYGPGYTSDYGFAILTANKQLGIYSEHQRPGSFSAPSGLIITSLSGAFKTNKLSGTVGGYDSTSSFFSLSIGSPP